MRWISSFLGILAGIAVIAVAARFLGLEDFVRRSIEAGHLLDWVMGGLSLVWLLVILKAPWDLFFQANTVAFEQQRSRERGIALVAGREQYVYTLRTRLLWLAIGAHLISALLIAGVTFFTHGSVGYWFAVFYLISTIFRPTVAGYVYLAEKLKMVGEESRYPREDIEEMRHRLDVADSEVRRLEMEFKEFREFTADERVREAGERERLEAELTVQRQSLHAMSREFEATVSRLTDNQDVIRGIQAFVRLIRVTGDTDARVTP